MKTIKEKLIRYRIVLEIYRFFKGKKLIFSDEEKIINFMLVPSHGNIGDCAIALATKEFLERNYPDYKINYYHDGFYKYKNIKKISKDSFFIIQGGGSFGDLYEFLRWERKDLIRRIKNNKVIIFPQTIYYDDDKKKKEDIEFFRKYELNIMTREERSFEMSKDFKTSRSKLFPDIVTSYKYNKEFQRDGIMILKRNDIEKKISNKELYDKIEKVCGNKNLKKSDTTVDVTSYDMDIKEKLVMEKLDEIAQSELIITDRLHGLIFSYITKTPVIVLSANTKILDSYNTWFTQKDNIVFLNSIEEINEKLINGLINKKKDNMEIFTPSVEKEMKIFIDTILNEKK